MHESILKEENHDVILIKFYRIIGPEINVELEIFVPYTKYDSVSMIQRYQIYLPVQSEFFLVYTLLP